jgi:TP901 family phage tail tape measure protein
MANFPIGLKIKAFDSFSKTFGKASRGLKTLGKSAQMASNQFAAFQLKTKGLRTSLGKIGGSIKGVGSTLTGSLSAPLALVGGGVIKLAADFEAGMNKVSALTGATGGALAKLEGQAQELGASTKFSATQAADAMAFLGQAGFKTNEIYKATPALLNLAAASGTDLARSADIASNIMGAFGLSADESNRVADVLAATTASANVDMEMLAETMKFAGPVAKQFGASLEDTAAAAGLLGNLGIQGTNAGTALKRAFLGLANPVGKSRKLLNAMGVTVADSAGKLLPFGEIMKTLGGRLKELPQKSRIQVLESLFGKIGIAGGAALQEFAETGQLEKFAKELGNTEGRAKQMADTMNKGAKGGMIALKSAIEGLAISIGKSGILEEFTKIVKSVTGFVRGLTKTKPGILKWAFILGIAAAAIGPLLLAIGGFLAVIPMIVTGAGLLGTAFSVMLGPIGLAVAGIIAAGFLLFKNWETIKGLFMGLWSAISGFFDTNVGKILQIILPFIGIPMAIFRHWEPIKAFFGELWESVAEKFSGFIEFVTEFGTMLFNVVSGIFGKFADVIKSKLENAFGVVDKMAGKLLNILPSGLKVALGFDTPKPAGVDTPKVPGINTPKVPGKDVGKNIIDLESKRKEIADKKIAKKEAPESPVAKSEANIKVELGGQVPPGTKVRTAATGEAEFNVTTGLQGGAL